MHTDQGRKEPVGADVVVKVLAAGDGERTRLAPGHCGQIGVGLALGEHHRGGARHPGGPFPCPSATHSAEVPSGSDSLVRGKAAPCTDRSRSLRSGSIREARAMPAGT